MIRSFSDKEAVKIFRRESSEKIPRHLQKIIYRKLIIIDSAVSLIDLKSPPGNNLKKLKGNRDGQYSTRINNQWRICFYWNKGNAYEVEIVDYH
ncbi:MAG: type II toxin-antitoxin system RelE/ParE family toxin [Candidatus Paceibacterota bacterium]